MKKVLKITGKVLGILLILLLIAIGILYMMKDKIIAAVVDEMETGYQVEMEYEDVNLSIFRNFPRLSLGIEQLQVSTEEADLAKLQELDIAVDFYSLWSSTEALRIHSFKLIKPFILYEVYEDSTSNWDVFLNAPNLQSDSSQTGSSLRLSLDQYAIKQGHLIYIDHTTGSSLEVINLNHSGAGELSAMQYDLTTKSSIDTIIYHSKDLDFHAAYPLKVDAIIQVDNEKMIYKLSDATIQYADLKTELKGEVATLDSAYKVNLQLKDTKSDIKQLLSFIPDTYLQDYKNIQSSGQLSIQGSINGILDTRKDIYPAIDFTCSINNGQLQYPQLPKTIKDIQLSAEIHKPEGELDRLELSVNPMQFRLGNSEPLRVRFSMKSPFSGPHINGEIKGSLNLNALAAAIPIEEVKSMNGMISTDLLFDVFYPAIAAENYDKIDINGNLSVKSASIKTQSYPLVKINDIQADISNAVLDIKSYDLAVGRSDFSGSLRLEQPVLYFKENAVLKGAVKLHSQFLDVNQFMDQTDESPSASANVAKGEESMVPALFKRLDMAIDFTADKLNYDVYELSRVQGNGDVKNGVLSLDKLTFGYLGNPYTVRGELHDIMAYLYQQNGVVYGNLDITGEKFDLWDYMNSGGESAVDTAESSILSLPDQMNLKINADIDKVSYGTYALNNLDTRLHLSDQELIINSGRANLFNGDIQLSGTFVADGKSLPSYDFNYKMQNIGFAEAYKYIVTFKKLAPIAQFIEGIFNTSLQIKGSLTKDLMPAINSLDISGIVETLNAQIKQYAPLSAIADKLQLKNTALENINISNTKNYININNGALKVKPFPIHLKEIDATVHGTQQIDGTHLDYTIAAKIPCEWLNKNAATANINKGINWVSAQAQQYGLNLDAGDYVYVDILLNGSIKNPKVGLQLKNIGGKSVKESIQEEIKEETKKVQDSLKNAIKKEKERLRNKAKRRMDSLKQAAKEAARQKAKELLTGKKDSNKNGVQEEINKTKKKAEEEIKNIKDKFDKWNPFDN